MFKINISRVNGDKLKNSLTSSKFSKCVFDSLRIGRRFNVFHIKIFNPFIYTENKTPIKNKIITKNSYAFFF